MTLPQLNALSDADFDLACARAMEPEPRLRSGDYGDYMSTHKWWWRNGTDWEPVHYPSTSHDAAGPMRAECGRRGLGHEFATNLYCIVKGLDRTAPLVIPPMTADDEFALLNATPRQIATAALIVLMEVK